MVINFIDNGQHIRKGRVLSLQWRLLTIDHQNRVWARKEIAREIIGKRRLKNSFYWVSHWLR